jgi:diguanylate cyclase (GGDEF)-like protein
MTFINTYALLIHQASQANDLTTPTPIAPRVMLRSVSRTLADGIAVPLVLSSVKSPPTFTQDDFSIRFEFALPEYARDSKRRYQAKLVGHDRQLSEWSTSRAYTYSSLNPGEYTLQLRAKDSNGNETEIDPFTFVVEPRWYASGWARSLMGGAVLILAWGLLLLYTHRRTKLLAKQNLSLENKVAARTKELAEANRRLDMMAHIDGLTGIANRRKLDEYLPIVWKNSQNQNKPISILIIDVDHFKQYNDSHGHLAGDELLRSMAERLLPCLRRAEDLLARYGGEEFMVIMPGADAEIARSTAEAMRQVIETSSYGVTISIGVCTHVPGTAQTMAAHIRCADDALYQAKKAGRNRVVAQTS